MLSREASSRPYTVGSFRMKLALFEQFIQDFTYVDEELNPEERRQILQARLTNGYEPFCEAIRKLFGNDVSTQDLKALFRKIALNPDAQVDWSELFGIGGSTNEVPDLLLNEDTSSVFTTSKRRSVGEAGGDKKRRDVVQCIVYVPKYGFYIIASQKGIICQWSNKFRLQSCIDLNESSWITGCGFLPSLRRIAVTSERIISLWDFRAKGKQSTIYQIGPMDYSPQCMIYIPWKTDSMNEDTILFGDDHGYVNMITISSKDLHMKTSLGKADSQVVTVDPSKLTYAIQRRKFHDNWVVKLKYFPQLDMFGSCSPSSNCSFILGSIERILDNSPARELAVPKGVNCFDYCAKANVIITAGADKVIRVWHPLIFTRPTGKLLGHLFTIVDIAVNEKDQQLISLSSARVFRVWDIQTLTCLQVFTDNEVRPGEKRISCMLFDSKHDRLITGCSVIDTWPLTRAIQESLQVPHTHDRPICQLLYNPHMNQVISGCAEGVLKVWEMETGQPVYQVTDAHGSSIEITAMTVDSSGYRLATGGYDGSIKVWDFGSGQLYKSFPDEPAKSKHHEDTITGLVFHTMHNKRCLLVSSWGKKIRVMEDPSDLTSLVELNVLSDVYIPPTPSAITREDHGPFISRAPLPTIGETSEVTPTKWEHLLSLCEVTCLEHASPLFFAGTTDGSIILWNLETEKIAVRFEPPKSKSARTNKHRRNNQDEQLVYACLYLVHRVRKPVIYGKTQFQASARGLESISTGKADENVEEEAKEEKETSEADGKEVAVAELEGEKTENSAEGRNQGEEGLPVEADGSHSTNDPRIIEERASLVKEDAHLSDFLQVSDPALVSCHHDGFLRFWNLSGTLLSEIRPVTRRQASAVTAMCTDADSNYVISGDARGYITVWDVGNFLLDPPSGKGVAQQGEASEASKDENKNKPKNVINQVVCWRGHLTRVVGLEHVDSSDVLVSASTDCSVRIWYRNTGHFIGFFSQPRLWHLPSAKSVPSTPVRPYDISEGPIRTLKAVASRTVTKHTESNVDCPLVFDDARWLPFRHSAKKETKSKGNKKFFESLSKPKHYNSHLESFRSGSPETGAVYRALPVYRIDTPERLRTPAINMQSSWLTNQAQNGKGQANKATFAYRSSSSSRKPVVSRFPHIVQGYKR